MFYRNLIYQRVTAISLYMLFGGTNWGHSACPVVATSYDYSSPVSENRALWSKYSETKLLTLFTRVARDLAKTDRLATGTNYTTNGAITVSELRNPDTNAGFYVIMHADSTSSTTESFKVHINTSEGSLSVPEFSKDVVIAGHQAKILVTDFSFGSKTLLYSTAEILSFSIIDGKEVLALWLPEGSLESSPSRGLDQSRTQNRSRRPVSEPPPSRNRCLLTRSISELQYPGLRPLVLVHLNSQMEHIFGFSIGRPRTGSGSRLLSMIPSSQRTQQCLFRGHISSDQPNTTVVQKPSTSPETRRMLNLLQFSHLRRWKP
uniref:Beta-galactosidase domain-containing protein n=1 Tax=Bionectria ochroleuca TaxID=29856 RepID=A0A8H7NP88_BIOOC